MRLLVAALACSCAGPALAGDLTLHRVMLSAAGVGYFEFSAPMDGPGTVGLDVPLAQVDDVLASLAVFDDQGGVGSVELPGHDNARQAFDDVPFTEVQLASPQALLSALRGQDLAVTGPFAMHGSIVSVESEAGPVRYGQPAVPPHTRVTLLTSDGFRQFILEAATAIKLTDPVLNAHIGAALQAARQQTAAATRHLTLRSAGAGARTINVGYVAEAPLWKASYRVVLPQAGGDHARVQGWAVLENQSGVDWKGVDLTLQAGNPVTFHEAIYSSYYANRPEVPVEVMGRLLPEPDERAMPESGIAAAQGSDRAAPNGYVPPPEMNIAPPPQEANAPVDDAVHVRAGRRMSRNYGSAGAAAFVPYAPAMAAPVQVTQTSETPIDTSFHIPTPVDLARGNSASVPILDQSIPAEPMDLLPANSTRPITALRLTNTLSTSLPAGILTLYTTTPEQGAAFAGDARLSGLPAGESRLLAFAEDLRTTATRETSNGPDTIVHVKLVDGVLTQLILHRTIMKVSITAPPHEARRVMVEFPKTDGASFVLLQGHVPGQEETASAWRVKVDIKAGDTYRLTAYADTPDTTSQTLLPKGGDLDNDVLVSVLSEPALDAVTRAKLQNLADLRAAEAKSQTALQKLTDERDALTNDEQRVRANIQAVFNPGELREKLLSELATDESELAKLADEIHAAQATVAQAHTALQDAARRLTF